MKYAHEISFPDGQIFNSRFFAHKLNVSRLGRNTDIQKYTKDKKSRGCILMSLICLTLKDIFNLFQNVEHEPDLKCNKDEDL